MTTAAIITISVIALVYIIAKNIQLYKFTSYMHTCMDELYEQDRCEKESISIYIVTGKDRKSTRLNSSHRL